MLEVIEYKEYDPCPYQPMFSKESLEKYLAKSFYKMPYNRFMWWKGYTPKKKPLTGNVMVIAKLESGAYDEASYRYELQLCEHRLRDRFFELKGDYSHFLEDQAVELARRKRLKEDIEKDEINKLELLKKDFSNYFRIPKNEIEEVIINTPGEKLITVYKNLEKKYFKKAGK